MATPIPDINVVSRRALKGSPRDVVTENILRNGITPSAAIAWSKRGAPKKVGSSSILC